ncbi:MAG: hypothetical protein GXY70_00375 [Euryarchaeota archaeon]|nr:hypothetical protein [Euryarchaeota archaeon]
MMIASVIVLVPPPVVAEPSFVRSATGWAMEIVDCSGQVGEYASLALDTDDKAHISYWDRINQNLVYATNADGRWKRSVVDDSGNVGMFTSIAVNATGTPHISYYAVGSQDLRYATFADGIWIILTVDSAGDVGQYSSLALDAEGKATSAIMTIPTGTSSTPPTPGDGSCLAPWTQRATWDSIPPLR